MAKKSRYTGYKNGIDAIQESAGKSSDAAVEDRGQPVHSRRSAVSGEHGNTSVLGKLKALKNEASAEAVKGMCE